MGPCYSGLVGGMLDIAVDMLKRPPSWVLGVEIQLC